VVLLHGLVSTGEVFGAACDRLTDTHRVVITDLLGFGRSPDETLDTFTVDQYLDGSLVHIRCTRHRKWPARKSRGVP
jgi:pimeloyl-ACP methyl ester carboxylesterase